MLQVEAINRYPLKSAAAESLDVGELKLTGLTFDRHWMVVTESGRFISQRDKGAQKLALVRTALLDEGLELIAPDQDPIIVPYVTPNQKRIQVELHDKKMEGIDLGDEAARWISSYLPKWRGESFRIVYFPEDSTRSVKGLYTQQESAVTEFADGYAVLIANPASLNALNDALIQKGEDPVEMSVFRPNIVISGLKPWGEDVLKEFRIGDAVLEIIKPCGRCPITGVNQETGSFSSNPKEPRDTLTQIHRGEHVLEQFPNLEDWLVPWPMFGQNAIVVKPGSFKVGDRVDMVTLR